ncbi:MAG: DNA recombination protein RmuC [Kineosporiaceae bacterium]|nr:DNA recombination protein RmuC [Kineosporiaceae bacterium]MBK8078717.1 DNA recombination protein RmuC [Kineosporiaceae bacterium]
MTATTMLALLAGLLGGAVLTWLLAVPLHRERLARALGESELLRERITDLEGAASQDRELAATLAPLAGSLGRVEQQVQALERDRIAQMSTLSEQLALVRTQTTALAGALRSPTSRGVWGEVQLRRVVEHAGMLARVDFTPQAHVMSPNGGSVRPDLVVHLPGGKNVVVDAKAPLAAFLEASEAPLDHPDGAARRAQAATAHARALRAHVEALAAKEYWRAFDPCPELVICFVPGEAFLAEACSADPALLEHAMARRVVLATPTTLLALLRTVALTWQTEALSGSAREVFTVGRELYARLGTLAGHTTRLGRSLERAVEDYNGLVGTLERRVLVSARRLNDLELTDDVLPSPTPLLVTRRPLTAPELLDDAAG